MLLVIFVSNNQAYRFDVASCCDPKDISEPVNVENFDITFDKMNEVWKSFGKEPLDNSFRELFRGWL